MRRLTVSMWMLWFLSVGGAAAQGLPDRVESSSGSTTVTAAAMDELLERLEALQQRVESLERQHAARGAGAPPAPQTPADPGASPTGAGAAHEGQHQPSVDALQNLLLQQQQQEQYPSLRLHGFADVTFGETSAPDPLGFQMGQLVLHLASALGPKVSAFAETSFTARRDAPGYAPDVERAIVRYDYADAFKLSFGRYHTPIGYWNNAYHHGLFLQTTIERPEMVQFGTTLQPVHFVGVLAEGNLPGSSLGLGYSAGIGNGRGAALRSAGDAGDVNDHRAWLANIFSRPVAVRGLQFGASVYRDRLSPGGGRAFDEWITSAHLAWTNDTPEIVAEFANVRHVDRTTGAAFDTPAYYVQTAYRLPWHGARWKPYYRYDGIDPPAGQPLLHGYEVRKSSVGVRFDVADFAAFKGEYRRTRRATAPGGAVNGVFLQTAFTF